MPTSGSDFKAYHYKSTASSEALDIVSISYDNGFTNKGTSSGSFTVPSVDFKSVFTGFAISFYSYLINSFR